MLFNSLEFALFLPLVFLAYWAIPAARLLRPCSLPCRPGAPPAA